MLFSWWKLTGFEFLDGRFDLMATDVGFDGLDGFFAARWVFDGWYQEIPEGIEVGGVHGFFVVVGGDDEFEFLFVFAGGGTDGGLLWSIWYRAFLFEGNFDADVDNKVIAMLDASIWESLYFILGVMLMTFV